MTRITFSPLVTAALFVALAASSAYADLFGSGVNQFEIPFVPIGAPRNPPDTTGTPNPAGRVDRAFLIGQFEVPEEAITKANAASALAGSPLNLTMSVARGPQKPATGLRWTDVARFVNWLNREVGAPPAYKFDSAGAFQLWTPADPGYNPQNLFRNRGAEYFLPSVDEWYKAAYYDAINGVYYDYATGSDTPPTAVAMGTDPNTAVYNQLGGPADVMLAGGASPFGAVGMSGNVFEWEETAYNLLNSSTTENRGVRSGSYLQTVPLGVSNVVRVEQDIFSFGASSLGFRIARVPEIAGFYLITLVLVARLSCIRR